MHIISNRIAITKRFAILQQALSKWYLPANYFSPAPTGYQTATPVATITATVEDNTGSDPVIPGHRAVSELKPANTGFPK